MLQLYELCRLCAQKKKQKLDLFSGLTHEETRILLSKISLCLSVQVTKEDLLPKMICTDCQRTVEQFNSFRVKCHKAEERLNKMLSLSLPSKAIVTRIKQESVELDSHEIGNTPINLDLTKCNDTAMNLKPVKNVKCEVEESDSSIQWNPPSSDLIQIISEEMASQKILDIKQPQIEIISENFNEEFKTIWDDQNHACDIKVLPEVLFRTEANIIEENLGFDCQNKSEVLKISEEIKQQESDDEENGSNVIASVRKRPAEKDKKKRKNKSALLSNEIDEKYLILRKDEVCDIDLEEMDALIKKKQDPNVMFSCDKCNKSFKFFKCLRKHKQGHSSEPEMLICELCKNENLKCFEFSSRKSLANHIQRKHSSVNLNKFVCGLCRNVFTSQGQLNAHFKKVHDDSGAVCLTCGKQFKNKACLNGHAKVHQEERPYVCDKCGQTFKWSNALKVHILWHKQEKNFLCSECGKKFTAKKNLVEHLNIHIGKRPYVCGDCNASFTQFSAYSKHLYLHNERKERVHKCGKCDKTFSHAYLLKQHLIRHTGLRPYECSTCSRTFKSQSDLCCHVKIHQEKQYGCHVCGKKFAVSKTLRDHMVRHTGIKHICPVPGCGKTYTQRFSLTKHFCKQHPLLSIVRKKSGKKAPVETSDDNQPEEDFIRYNFEEKDVGRDSPQNSKNGEF